VVRISCSKKQFNASKKDKKVSDDICVRQNVSLWFSSNYFHENIPCMTRESRFWLTIVRKVSSITLVVFSGYFFMICVLGIYLTLSSDLVGEGMVTRDRTGTGRSRLTDTSLLRYTIQIPNSLKLQRNNWRDLPLLRTLAIAGFELGGWGGGLNVGCQLHFRAFVGGRLTIFRPCFKSCLKIYFFWGKFR